MSFYENDNYIVITGESANKDYPRVVYLVQNKKTKVIEHECLMLPEATGAADKLNNLLMEQGSSIPSDITTHYKGLLS